MGISTASTMMIGKDLEDLDNAIVPAFHDYHSELLIQCPSILTSLKGNSVNKVPRARIIPFQSSKQKQQSQAEHKIYKYTKSQQVARAAICIHNMQYNIAYMYTSSALLALFTFCKPTLLYAHKEVKVGQGAT